MLNMINIYIYMDGLMLYHYMNIASPRISNQLSVLAFKFHPKLTIFRWWIILQIPLNPGNLDSIPARTSPSKTNICCLVHQCSPYLLVESPVLKPIEPQLVKQYHQMATSPRCLSVSPSAAIAGFRASARWSWRSLGLVVLVGKNEKNISIPKQNSM